MLVPVQREHRQMSLHHTAWPNWFRLHIINSSPAYMRTTLGDLGPDAHQPRNAKPKQYRAV